MLHNSTRAAFFSFVLTTAVIFSLSLVGIAAAQDNAVGVAAARGKPSGNTRLGKGALHNNTTERPT